METAYEMQYLSHNPHFFVSIKNLNLSKRTYQNEKQYITKFVGVEAFFKAKA